MATAHADVFDTDILSFLERHQNKDLLRFVAVGSVDDGKSTLIGRLLHDTGEVYEDHLADARSGGEDDEIDFALLTDGLRAEREQGITIDVAYRYFTTARRKFIIADTPGHVQYTRNMATGASTADLAIILIDARLGVLQQSRRHAYIASLLGIRHLLVAVNKMDLVDYDREVYDVIRRDLEQVLGRLAFSHVAFLPISALEGDNVVRRSTRLDWYTGPTLIEYLETVDIARDRSTEPLRYPVQSVIRPHQDYRGFAGQVASGAMKKGDLIRVLPSGETSRIQAIDTFSGEIDRAFAPMSVTLRLEDEVDVSRGDLIVHRGMEPEVGRRLRAMLVWMHHRPLDTRKSYLLKHGTAYLRAEVPEVLWKVDLSTLEQEPAGGLALNDIGCVELLTHRPITFDPYVQNRSMGAFIVIDSLSNATVAAGMLVAREQPAPGEVEVLHGLRPRSGVSPDERHERHGHRAATLWLTGLPASGKSSIAYALERRLFDRGCAVHVLDPEASRPERGEVYEAGVDLREAAAACAASCAAGLITICAFASPTRADRQIARGAACRSAFFEIHVATPLEVCRARDVTGIYASGLPVPGVGLPYEAPTAPDLLLSLEEIDLEDAVDLLVELLQASDVLPP